MESNKKRLSQKRLKELIDYDPETGVFTWKVSRQGTRGVGGTAGTINSRGYVQIAVDCKLHRAHRLAWLFMEGYTPTNIDIDHIDRDPANNRWANLRIVSRTCNLRNCKTRRNNKSGLTGVYWCNTRRKWHAQIMVSGKRINLGRFKTKREAVKARWEAEGKHGFKNCNATSSSYKYLKKRRHNEY